MQRKQSEKSIELQLRALMDKMVLEPEQKKHATRAMKNMLHESKVGNIKGLRKAMDKFLYLVLKEDITSNGDD